MEHHKQEKKQKRMELVKAKLEQDKRVRSPLLRTALGTHEKRARVHEKAQT